MTLTVFDRDAAIKAHRQKKLVKEQYSKKDWGLDLSLEDLALISATFPSAQQYGPKFEKWINRYLNWEAIRPKVNRGDSKVKGKDVYIEQKWCIRTDVGPNGLQHRLWQDVQYYLYGHVDDKDSDNIRVDLYLLTKAQVLEEFKLLTPIMSHGTKDSNILNENVEYTMGVAYGSADHQRWKDKYLVTLDELKNYNF